MPEGHSVHRIANQFARSFLHAPLAVSSPQGRFAAGAAELDGHAIVESRAVGKQMFLEFDHGLTLRVHLGMYGAWDFAGDIHAPPRTADVGVEPGAPDRAAPAGIPSDRPASARDREDSRASIGAPRLFRMSESERLGPAIEGFPPEPVGAVRVRLLSDVAVADLRGPTACEVLDPEGVALAVAKIGPDPLVDRPKAGEDRFVRVASRKPTPVGLLLMDQSVIAGIGNIYRAELLFRARVDPHRPGREVPEDVLRALWRDWTTLLKRGVESGLMITMDRLGPARLARARADRSERHWVYHRTGLPCRVCGFPVAEEIMAGRKLYWCPFDQT